MLKKSQVSIFIIIGIIIVIVATFMFFNGKYEFFQTHDTKLKNQVSDIVKDCIYDAAERGTFLIGFQGGYINIPRHIESNPFAYTDFGLKIPNWDVERGDIPTISSMESELDFFIESESYGCIVNNLRALEDAFDIDIDNEIKVESRINNENVGIEASLAIRFNEKNSQNVLTVSDYYVRLDNLRLGDLYLLAAEIYNLEAQTYLFEDLVLDQIQTTNDYSSEFSMPSEGMSISCGSRIWTIPQLKRNLASMNNNNFKYLYFEGTYPKTDLIESNLNDEFDSKILRDYFEKIYTFKLQNTKKSFSNYNVEVLMPSTEITSRQGILQSYPFRTFEVTPSSGQVVKSMEMKIDAGAKIPIPCIQIYHHLYTLDYDLIVKLSDYNDDGKNFHFQFPLRIEIDKNTPKKSQTTPIFVEERSTFNNDNFCANESKMYPMMIITTDNEYNVLENVNISYKCINLKCDMGETKRPFYNFAPEIRRENAQSELIADFPFCVGGTVIGEKEGYHTAKVRVDTTDNLLRRETYIGDNLVELNMIPLKSFGVDAGMFLMISKETRLGKRVLTENDGSIFVSIENKEHEFESMAIWPNEPQILDKLEFLMYDDVVYNLSVIYMDSNYELKGMLEIENWNPQIHSGNNLRFNIPSTDYKVEEDNYLEFYEYIRDKSINDADFKPRFY